MLPKDIENKVKSLYPDTAADSFCHILGASARSVVKNKQLSTKNKQLYYRRLKPPSQ
jgi:hypothetical protein